MIGQEPSFDSRFQALLQPAVTLVYVHIAGDAFPEGDLSQLSDGPTLEQRKANRARAVVEVTGLGGSVTRSVIETVNGYSYTPLAAVEAARRVLNGERQPGFATPARVFREGSP